MRESRCRELHAIRLEIFAYRNRSWTGLHRESFFAAAVALSDQLLPERLQQFMTSCLFLAGDGLQPVCGGSVEPSASRFISTDLYAFPN
jgi:hypothetical protein